MLLLKFEILLEYTSNDQLLWSMKGFIFAITTLLSSVLFSTAQNKGGILGELAPEILVDQWMHIPEGEKVPTPESLKDKIVYIYCYQSWCPGCHSSGFPTLKQVSETFKDSTDIEFLAVHTVFEGFSINTPAKWKAVADRHKLHHLRFAHSGSEKKRSSIMKDFRTRGTPWTIIIGKDGKVKYNAFHIQAENAIELINTLNK